MDIFQAFILGIVEGLTEYLPVSSTGHMVLVSELLKVPQSEFVKNFEVIIQVGAILAVAVIFGKKLWYNKQLWPKLLVAFLPTALIGLALYKVIKVYFLGNTVLTLWALLLGGIAMIVWEKLYKEKAHHLNHIENLSYKKSFIIGLAQSISVIPGVSRSAATIFGGLGVGLTRQTAVEMSFLLALPTLAAASGLDLVKSHFHFSPNEWMLLAVGFVTAFVTALLAVKFFLKYVTNHNLIAFGVYRIILAVLFWFFLVR
jgi:undecaprenyl-diphosphatase